MSTILFFSLGLQQTNHSAALNSDTQQIFDYKQHHSSQSQQKANKKIAEKPI